MKMQMTFELGKTKYGQDVTLIAQPQPDGTYLYDLVKHPANQIDDKVTIHNLPEDVIREIATAHSLMEHMRKRP